jgi:hypothetical protein
MMGYLTAVEQYLAHLDGLSFSTQSLLDAARELEGPARLATRRMMDSGFAETFEHAVEALQGEG